jgi:hypothetical protein
MLRKNIDTGERSLSAVYEDINTCSLSNAPVQIVQIDLAVGFVFCFSRAHPRCDSKLSLYLYCFTLYP